MRDRKHIFENIDLWTIGIYLSLMIMGWFSIYAAVYDPEHASIFDMGMRYGKQSTWIIASLFIATVIIIIDPKFFNQFSYLIYGFMILTLVGVLFFGQEVAGSKSWFQIGSFKIQPAEFVKFATALALATYLSNLGKSFKNLKVLATVGFIIGLPALLILKQNDTGSALVYGAFIFVLYRVGLSGNVFIVGSILVLIAILALILSTVAAKLILIGVLIVIGGLFFLFMKRNWSNALKILAGIILLSGFVFSVDFAFSKMQPHQQDRILVTLNIKEDPKGVGYNVIQSKIAIGSGGFTGKGFKKGTQTKYDFVPEQSTDFIFCTVGEEMGFVGSSIVIILFVALLLRLIFLAERQRSIFSKIYGYAVVSILFFHFTINLGMVMGLLPVIGIPLPFFSYGGSSLWAFTILLFIFIRQDSERLYLL